MSASVVAELCKSLLASAPTEKMANRPTKASAFASLMLNKLYELRYTSCGVSKRQVDNVGRDERLL